MLACIVVFLLAAATGTVIWVRNSNRLRFRERGWALFILIIGTVFIMAQILRIPVSNPADWIAAIFSPVYRPIIKWIEKEV